MPHHLLQRAPWRLISCALLICARPASSLPVARLIRLDKLLADRGAGSRKDIDRLIRKGRVEINGEIVGKSGAKLKVSEDAVPVVDGYEFPPPPLLAAYHKPLGVVSTMRDERGRECLVDAMPPVWQKLLHPVGRLDADTTGLLLFSRDGALTHKMLHPKSGVEREYVAVVEGDVEPAALREKLAAGVTTVENGVDYVVFATLLEAEGQSVRLTVTEGKHRMVRRILANCGHPVQELHRTRYGGVTLGDIAEGECDVVSEEALRWAEALLETRAPAASARRAPRAVGSSSAPAADAQLLEPDVAFDSAELRAELVGLGQEEAEIERLVAEFEEGCQRR